MAKNKSIVTVLEGGGGAFSIGKSDEVAERVLLTPDLFPELVFGLWHVDGVVRTRVANAIEKVTSERPELLQPFKKDLLGLMPHAQPEAMQLRMAQIMPRLELNSDERDLVMSVLRSYLGDEKFLARPCEVDSLVNLAAACEDRTSQPVAQLDERQEYRQG